MPTQKTITFYQCNICKRDYDTSAEATACENSHGTLAIERASYNDDSVITKEFPESIIISNGNGASAKYCFARRFDTNA